MSELVNRQRIPYDAWEKKSLMFQIKGQCDKDAYITLYASDDHNKVKEIFYKFPDTLPGQTIRVINANNRVYKGLQRTIQRKNRFYRNGTTWDFELEGQGLFDFVCDHPIYFPDTEIDVINSQWSEPTLCASGVSSQLVDIANKETKRQKLARTIKNAARSFLSVISGGK